ncbi:hypothetical protein [Streptomyces sp. NPDC060002]|uniref:hypothetical protein n=1 Tax=Streptomyces sp. NPDC060002 TaxID=3347033 RepID=UPI00367C485B
MPGRPVGGLWQQPDDLARDLDRAGKALRWSVAHRRSAAPLDEVGHRIHLAERTAAALHCLTSQLRTADGLPAAGPPAGHASIGPGPLLDAVRHALIRALDGADPAELIAGPG